MTTSKDTSGWGSDESEFPTRDIAAYEFYTDASDETGESITVQCRIPPKLGRRIDEAIQEGKEMGVPLRTVSDFVRWCLMHGLEDFVKYVSGENETLQHFLLLEREAERVAYQTSMLTRVRESVTMMTQGLTVLTSSSHGDWTEAKSRITQFLIPILQMAGDQDFLMLMYVRELFSFKAFQRVVDILNENNIPLGPTIENASKAYEKIIGEKGEG
jgi:hypothetical protein